MQKRVLGSNTERMIQKTLQNPTNIRKMSVAERANKVYGAAESHKSLELSRCHSVDIVGHPWGKRMGRCQQGQKETP